MKQRSLGFGTAHRLARQSDPDTSQQGAAYVALSLKDKQLRALNIIIQHPSKTASELDAINESQDRQVGKRLHELERMGCIKRCEKRRCNITGRMAYTWRKV